MAVTDPAFGARRLVTTTSLGMPTATYCLEGNPARSPAEALRSQQGEPETRQVPVYASDGTTVVDTFTVNR
jgi:hypothetical protein